MAIQFDRSRKPEIKRISFYNNRFQSQSLFKKKKEIVRRTLKRYRGLVRFTRRIVTGRRLIAAGRLSSDPCERFGAQMNFIKLFFFFFLFASPTGYATGTHDKGFLSDVYFFFPDF